MAERILDVAQFVCRALVPTWFTIGPKATMVCAHCSRWWKARLPMDIDNPVMDCPRCNGPNRVPITWDSELAETSTPKPRARMPPEW